MDKKELLDCINERIKSIKSLMLDVDEFLKTEKAKLLNERFKGRLEELEILKNLVKTL